MYFKSIIITIIFVSLSAVAKPSKIQNYGDPFAKKEVRSVTEVVNNANKFKNKTIQIEGLITDVCPMKGCWIKLKDPKSKNIIEVKVKDDVIVFPKDSVNKKATVKGKLVKKTLTKERAIKHLRHRAEELGVPFDPSTVKGPMDLWTLQGTGAQIKL